MSKRPGGQGEAERQEPRKCRGGMEQEAKLASFRNKDCSYIALRASQLRGSRLVSGQLHLVLRPGWGEYSLSKSLRAQLMCPKYLLSAYYVSGWCVRIGLLSRS